MFDFRRSRDSRRSLLDRYGAQLGRIVERHCAEAALQAARQEAERAAELAHEAMIEAQAASRAKTEFLANMSHELRSPLNAVIGFSQVMMDNLFGPLGSPKYDTYCRDIHASGNHLLSVINDILDLAKIEAGKVQLDEQLVDVDEVTAFCLSVIRDRAEARRIRLTHEVPAAVPGLIADEQKLKQMLINLLSNAVKFTLEGGDVTLRIEIDGEGCFLFGVRDTGIGMSEGDLQRVVEPFTQVDSGLNRRYEGTGLGLPITKSFMELHGGRLALESHLGVGTTATLVFPPSRVAAQHTSLTQKEIAHVG